MRPRLSVIADLSRRLELKLQGLGFGLGLGLGLALQVQDFGISEGILQNFPRLAAGWAAGAGGSGGAAPDRARNSKSTFV